MTRHLWLLMLITAQVASGQSGLREQLQQYTKSRIVPVLRKQRAQLEPALSKAEKKKIRKLRWDFRELMRESETQVTVSADMSDQVIFYFGNNQDLVKALLEEAWVIAGAHETTIDVLLAPIRQERKQWQRDWREMIRKYGKQDSEGEEHEILEFDGRFNRIFIPAFFVLWSPEGLIFDHTARQESYSLEASLRPNPVTGNELIVNLEIVDPGTYEASFIGMAGNINLSRTLEYTFEGNYEERLEVGSLVPGEYFLRISNTKATALLKFQRQ